MTKLQWCLKHLNICVHVCVSVCVHVYVCEHACIRCHIRTYVQRGRKIHISYTVIAFNLFIVECACVMIRCF